MPLLHRLSLVQKFMILGLLSLLLVCAPTFLYFKRMVEDVQSAQMEARGSGPLVALNKVIQLSQVHRGMSAGMLSGNEALAARRPAVRDALGKAMQVMDEQLRSAGVSEAGQKHWGELKQKWTSLEQAVASKALKAADSTKQHTQLISSELLLSEELLFEFGLMLDPEPDTYSLMHASLMDMPWLAENLGIMRAQGSGFLTVGTLTPEGRATLQSLQKRVQELQGSMFRNLEKATRANAGMKAALDQRAQAGRVAIDETLSLADKGLINAAELKMPATEYFDHFTRTIDGLFEFNALAMGQLTQALHARESDLQRSMYLMLGALLCGAAVALVLALAFIRSITGPVQEAVVVARAVADGDLKIHVNVLGSNELGQLMQALASMRDNLSRVVSEVIQGSQSVATASAEIAQGNNDLSSRTEQQASALEQTSASMEQLGATVRNNADNARQANQMAQSASEVAVRGGDVVGQVVNTMRDINDSSKKISDIIGVIDGIAFQTNILALNAAVEAARAGEQGRGFAVVASEVRSLAQRSAGAAKEIKSLISASVDRVEHGTELVDQAGSTMQEVVSAIRRVTDIVGEISSSSAEQSTGVAQVVEAVTQMDHTTQQNAALVEQSAAAADSLRSQAEHLLSTVAVFRT